jgi:hypothetical protein
LPFDPQDPLQQPTIASQVTPDGTQKPPSMLARQLLFRHSPLQHAVPEKHWPPGSVQVVQLKLLQTRGAQQSAGETQNPPSWQIVPPSPPGAQKKLGEQKPEQHWLGAKQKPPSP